MHSPKLSSVHTFLAVTALERPDYHVMSHELSCRYRSCAGSKDTASGDRSPSLIEAGGWLRKSDLQSMAKPRRLWMQRQAQVAQLVLGSCLQCIAPIFKDAVETRGSMTGA